VSYVAIVVKKRTWKIIYICGMEIKVFKFGGASVNSAKGIRNLFSILDLYKDYNILMVVSAMGKITNALEDILRYYMSDDAISMVGTYHKVRKYHFDILYELFPDRLNPVFAEVENIFDQLSGHIHMGHLSNDVIRDYNFEYDQIVSYGELISTAIIHHYLVYTGISSSLFDARELVRTDSTFMDARVDWDVTKKLIRSGIKKYFKSSRSGKVALTQGFIGRDHEGNTTTLGREGSDFTAAIFAFSLETKEMTIWKDVPGVMNADPKWFKNARKIDSLSFREAIELAYYGASIIHPKTIKPLENANITLLVRSFLEPGRPGTRIQNLKEWTITSPIYIRKQNQVLISISPRDFSFIMEENLSQVFNILASHQIKVNVMQNSAISFSVCVDNNHHAMPLLLSELQKNYIVRYNDETELYTIRHYNPASIRRISKTRKVLLEQKTRNTVHLVVIQESRQESHI
jgi:aspartate kinase